MEAQPQKLEFNDDNKQLLASVKLENGVWS